MIVVSNTSPVINLAAIGHLDLLEKLFQQIIISPAVYQEITVDGTGQPGSQEVYSLPWIKTKKVNNPTLVKALQGELDKGEAEAIALAIENKADLLLLDERKGREVASRFGIQCIGVLGILILAKENDYIHRIKPVVNELIAKAGFWVSPALYEYVLNTAGES